MRRWRRTFVLLALVPMYAMASADISEGVKAFQENRWKDAMSQFLDLLSKDPRNASAHTYVGLILKDVKSKQQSRTQEDRLQVLAQTSRRLEHARLDPRPIDLAILDTTQAEERTRQERWTSWCEQADVEIQMGHLLAANDLVFRVLAENNSHAEAQRQLSDLQIRLRAALDEKLSASSEKRYAWEGFYAYGQADFEAALTAWGKALELIRHTYRPALAVQHLSALRFGPYFRIAQARVDENRQTVRTHHMFEQASRAFAEGRYNAALQQFRKVAILNPEYPHLGDNLARTEAAVERERAERLGEAKRQEIAQLMEQGMSALERALYGEAERCFQQALELDPTHSAARSYLAMVQAEINRRHDPKAAQDHYEVGLVAYAGGKLDVAIREWTIATRMNPRHQKAIHALAKVRKELALNRDLP